MKTSVLWLLMGCASAHATGPWFPPSGDCAHGQCPVVVAPSAPRSAAPVDDRAIVRIANTRGSSRSLGSGTLIDNDQQRGPGDHLRPPVSRRGRHDRRYISDAPGVSRRTGTSGRQRGPGGAVDRCAGRRAGVAGHREPAAGRSVDVVRLRFRWDAGVQSRSGTGLCVHGRFRRGGSAGAERRSAHGRFRRPSVQHKSSVGRRAIRHQWPRRRRHVVRTDSPIPVRFVAPIWGRAQCSASASPATFAAAAERARRSARCPCRPRMSQRRWRGSKS